MSEFERLYDDEFFIIDSNELDGVNTNFYGYAIDNENIITNENFDGDIGLITQGAYIYIKKLDDNIFIYQDFEGSYGIHIYRNGDYFCISNSFFKLVDYLKEKHYPMSLNKDCADTLLLSQYSSPIYRQTLINEIEVLPRNYVVCIDLKSEKISFDIINFDEKSIPINSQEAMDILDDWFLRWTSLFRKLKSQTNNITVDLSGGYDSRMSFVLVLGSNIDLNQINVFSFNDGVHTHDEDFAIASEIASYYDFKLNNMSNSENERYYFEEIETPLNICFYTKLGFHNQMYYSLFKNKEFNYRITGHAGENIREYQSITPISEYLSMAEEISQTLIEPTQRILDYNVENVIKDFEGIYNDDIELGIYTESVMRYHFSKHSVENFLVNTITLNPLNDPSLYKLKRSDENCLDKDLLMCLIYLRFWPEIMNFRFGSGHHINEDTLNYAKEIISKYPFSSMNYNLVSKVNPTPNKNYLKPPRKLIQRSEIPEINQLYKDIFLSKAFEKSFEIYYPNEIYDFNKNKVMNMTYFPLQFAFSSFAILRVINDINIANGEYDKDISNWLINFLKIPKYDEIDISVKSLLLYLTSRIDLVNYGVDSDIKIDYCSDKSSVIKPTHWIKNGSGLFVESSKMSLDLNVTCINDGKLHLKLRSRDVRDSDDNRIPIFINYTKLIVNGESCLDDNVLVSHDTPYIYQKDVLNGENVFIHIEWDSFNG